MPAIAALALLAASGIARQAQQDSVALRINPPLGRVMEFSASLEASSLDGSQNLAVRLVTAERASAQGPNFRFSRYVSFVTAEGTGPFAGIVKDVKALAGRTFPLVLSPTGEVIRGKRGKWENDPDSLPNFAFAVPGDLAVGVAQKGVGMADSGKMTLRELRPLGASRAAVFDVVAGENSADRASGTVVASVEDGMVLLMDLSGETKSSAKSPAARIHLLVRRLNVEGLDRLAADLRIGE